MSGKSRDLSTEWGEWYWSEEHQCNYATRSGPTGELEYTYDTPRSETPRYGGEWVTDNSSNPAGTSPPDSAAGYTTIPSSSSQGKSSSVKTTQYKYQSSTGSSSMNGVTSGFSAMNLQPLRENLPLETIETPDGRQQEARQIKDRVSTNMLDDRTLVSGTELARLMYQGYVSIADHKAKKFWKPGRVFMMLWTEPASNLPPRSGAGRNSTAGSQYNTVWLGQTVYSEIRRFVVIGPGYGNVICSPIHTYQGQATLKNNLPDPQQHAIIHTSSSPPGEAKLVDGEGNVVLRENLVKNPIRVISELSGPDGDLGIFSRINYAKLYTVEKYVRILNIGRVHDDSMESLLASCFFARPDDEPPQGPRKHKSSSRSENRDDSSDTRGQSSKSGRHRRR